MVRDKSGKKHLDKSGSHGQNVFNLMLRRNYDNESILVCYLGRMLIEEELPLIR